MATLFRQISQGESAESYTRHEPRRSAASREWWHVEAATLSVTVALVGALRLLFDANRAKHRLHLAVHRGESRHSALRRLDQRGALLRCW